MTYVGVMEKLQRPDIPDFSDGLHRWIGSEAPPHILGPRHWWHGALDVEGLALGSAAVVLRALESYAQSRAPRLAGRFGASSQLVAGHFGSYQHLRVEGRAITGFAPLSAFHRASDGWVRLHANYPHHHQAVLTALGAANDAEALAALAGLTADEVESRLAVAGTAVAAVRTAAAWRDLAGDRAAEGSWLEGRAEPLPEGARVPRAGEGDAPLVGVRVLELARVIAGPTAGKILAALGAEVLRLDPPQLPEQTETFIDTCFAKRSALADLRQASTLARVCELVRQADVVIAGYRPGALERFGLDAEGLRRLNPRAALLTLSAWEPEGPWGARRGFDSIVQAATGIAHIYARPDGSPGALPVQALDHAAGMGLAAAALAILGGWSRGITGRVHVSLERTGRLLQSLPGPPAGEAQVLEPVLLEADSAHGYLRYVPVALTLDGDPLRGMAPPPAIGSAALEWS